MRAVPMSAWNRIFSPHRRYVPKRFRRDRAGERIHKLADAMQAHNPDYLYDEVVAQWNGKTVLSAQWGTAIAKNPFTQFTVKGAKAGDKISVSWVDNRGDRRTDEVTIA